MGNNYQFKEDNPPIFHLNIINLKENENIPEQQINNENIENASFIQNNTLSSIEQGPNSSFFSNKNEKYNNQNNLNNNEKNIFPINLQEIDENTVNVKIPINNDQTWEKIYNKEELIETVIKDYSQENNLNIPLNDFNEIFFDNKKVKINEKISNLLIQNNYIFNPYNNDLNESTNKKSIVLYPLNEEYIDVLGKPFYDPFEISCFYKSEKTFRILKYPPELIQKSLLINFGITSAYCNGYNNLYLSGGENSLDIFWIINLKENIIKEPIYISPKKNHSMIYIPKTTVFFVGGNTLDTFYYDTQSNQIFQWGKLNSPKSSPALILIKNKLFCIDSVNQNNYKVHYSFEFTELTKNVGNWVEIKPKLSFNVINRIFNQQLFAVVKDKDDNIIFVGGSLTDNEKNLNFMYNIKTNTIGLSLVKYKKFNVKERTFCPFNMTYDCLLTDFKRNSPQIAFYNKRKGKIDLINFSDNDEHNDNDNDNYNEINNIDNNNISDNNINNNFDNNINNNIDNNNNIYNNIDGKNNINNINNNNNIIYSLQSQSHNNINNKNRINYYNISSNYKDNLNLRNQNADLNDEDNNINKSIINKKYYYEKITVFIISSSA